MNADSLLTKRIKATKASRNRRGRSTAADPFFEAIAELAGSIYQLGWQAAREYEPIVQTIVRSGCTDANHIERTLDGLLDFCGNPDALLLYRKLCRHYYGLDPAAAAFYVNAYREMWDSEKENQP